MSNYKLIRHIVPQTCIPATLEVIINAFPVMGGGIKKNTKYYRANELIYRVSLSILLINILINRYKIGAAPVSPVMFHIIVFNSTISASQVLNAPLSFVFCLTCGNSLLYCIEDQLTCTFGSSPSLSNSQTFCIISPSWRDKFSRRLYGSHFAGAS